MEMTYRQNGDYLIPDIRLSGQETKPIGKYGQMRKQYLQEHRPILWNRLVLSEQLYPHLAEIDETAHQRLDELKNIADNAIESFYLKGAPSATNPPASGWTTDTLKKQHAGDLYMDTDTGYSYRWSGTEWVQVKDSDVTKALKEIESVKTTYATKSELKATDTELSGKV